MRTTIEQREHTLCDVIRIQSTSLSKESTRCDKDTVNFLVDTDLLI